MMHFVTLRMISKYCSQAAARKLSYSDDYISNLHCKFIDYFLYIMRYEKKNIAEPYFLFILICSLPKKEEVNVASPRQCAWPGQSKINFEAIQLLWSEKKQCMILLAATETYFEKNFKLHCKRFVTSSRVGLNRGFFI